MVAGSNPAPGTNTYYQNERFNNSTRPRNGKNSISWYETSYNELSW